MKASLLIADRDPALVEAVRRCLVARGYRISTAVTGLECYEQLVETEPTILVLDPELLWGGGDGVLEWLVREDSLIPPLTVITDGPPTARPVPDRLESWVDVRIQRPKQIGDLLTFVHQLESLAWWSQSPSCDAAIRANAETTASVTKS